MWKSPILEELYALREKHAKKFNYDLEAMMKDTAKRAAKIMGETRRPAASAKPVRSRGRRAQRSAG